MNTNASQTADTPELHVIFGTGPVGLTLADELLTRGKKVRIVNRSGRASVPSGVEVRGVDATDPAVVAELCRGAAVAYHSMNVPYAQQYEMAPRMQKAMIEGAGKTGTTLVVMDSLYMYGETHGKVMTEDTPYAATTRKGRMRAEIARVYLQAHEAGKVRAVLGRAADFYGPRVFQSSLGSFVFPPVLAGKAAQMLGNINLPHSYSYMKDVARGLATLGEHEEALGQAWLLPVVPAVTPREMLRIVGEAVGHPIRAIALPKIAVQAFGLFDSQMRELVEMFYQFTEPQIVDSGKFEAAFGWRATPLEVAIPETVAWFREQAKTAKAG